MAKSNILPSFEPHPAAHSAAPLAHLPRGHKVLAMDTLLAGIIIPAGTVVSRTFHHGYITATLDAPVRVGGITLAKGTTLQLYDDGYRSLGSWLWFFFTTIPPLLIWTILLLPLTLMAPSGDSKQTSERSRRAKMDP